MLWMDAPNIRPFPSRPYWALVESSWDSLVQRCWSLECTGLTLSLLRPLLERLFCKSTQRKASQLVRDLSSYHASTPTTSNVCIHRKTDSPTSNRFTYLKLIHLPQTDSPTSNWFTYLKLIHLPQTDSPTSNWFTYLKLIHLPQTDSPTSNWFTYLKLIHLPRIWWVLFFATALGRALDAPFYNSIKSISPHEFHQFQHRWFCDHTKKLNIRPIHWL